MVNQNKDHKPDYVCNNTSFSNSIFLAPVTEGEGLNMTSNLRGKLSAGYDEIPEKIVKLSIQSIKKTINLYI
jgi:hypothetical protein